MTLGWIGWVATAVFASSYLCREAASLRRVQAAAAVLWVVYGVLIQAAPVIVANLIVAGVALVSSLRLSRPPRIALCKASHLSENR
jgi:uncharacterized protein with PQ loop repeat